MSHPSSTRPICKLLIRYGIQFNVLTSQDVHKLSCATITHSDLYNGDQPTLNGPLDTRMGTSLKSRECTTCKKDFNQCPGHFGKVDLALPVFNYGYFKQILTILQMVCKYCGKILLFDEIRKSYLKKITKKTIEPHSKRALFEKIVKECKKNHKCPNCGAINGIVKKMEKNPQKIVHDKLSTAEDEVVEVEERDQSTSKQYEEIDPLKALKIFSSICNSDVLLMDIDPKINRPEHMIITKVAVPPSCIRPSVSVGEERTNEDDLTIKIGEIVSINNTIKACIEEGQPVSKTMENWMTLQYNITQYINSEAPGLPLNLLDKSKGICQRLKGKHGRFRGNLSGKRVDFTARTVISPDPNLKIYEVGVPKLMAINLTYPEKVTKFNIEQLRACVINGPLKHPGANFVKQEGSRLFLGAGNRRVIAEQLKIGDIVERHMDNGDLVLFNRQPSLHRISIMAFHAKILPWKTLRFNVCDCAPFNADFDGDEMNLHFPQCEEARAELKQLMLVKNNIVSPKNGEPIIACMQDFLTASYLITQKDTFFDRANFWRVCGYIGGANERIDVPPPAIVKPVELWTGKQVISVLLRPNKHVNVQVNCELKEKNYSGKNKHMCCNDGWVIVKNSQHICGNLCKPSIGASSKSGIIYSLLTENGVDAAAEFMQRFAKLTSLWLRNYGMSIGLTDVTPFERLLQEKKNLVDSTYKVCEEYIKLYNEGTIRTRPGCNAEQSLESYMSKELSKIRDKAGDLLKENLPKSNPALIMMICGSKGSNLNLCQMIACVGQQTVNGERIPNGFLNRSLPHFEWNSKTPEAKGFVSNSFYSGMTASEYFFHTMGGREGLVDTAVKTANTGYMQRRLMKAMEDLFVSYDYSVRNSSNDIIQFLYGDDGFDSMKIEAENMPINFAKLIDHTKAKYDGKSSDPITTKDVDNLNLRSMPFSTDRICLSLQEACNSQVKQNQIKSKCTSMIGECLSERQLKFFMEQVQSKMQSARVHPGEAVGAQAAMSIGEPATQMTLKTFHFAGVASMNVTLGVPRVIEIINANKDISTPIISVTLTNSNDERAARIVKGRIEKTVLSDICESIKEVYKPNGCYVVAKVDRNTVEKLGLEISMDSIKQSIIAHSKPKIKESLITVRKNKIIISPPDKAKEKLYFSMQTIKSIIPHIIVSGISTVGRAIINIEETDQGKTFNLFLEGTGLLSVLKIPGIEPYHTKTNHIIETEKVLGIEAARSVIISQIKYIMNEYSITVDPRHINLLADTMCCKGLVLGITRFGISRMKSSVLMQASFEKTIDHLFEAAGHSSYDKLEGVSERIILGIPINIGTGMCKVMHNIDLPKEYAKEPLRAFNGMKESTECIDCTDINI